MHRKEPADGNTESFIEMRDVCFRSANAEIVRNFSLQIEKGQSVAFVGAPGSGKSTVLKLAGGVLLPSAGKIFFEGKSIHDMTRSENLRFRKRSAFVFQNSALWANQSIQQNLELPLKLHFPDEKEKQRSERIQSCLSMVGYTKATNIRPAELSSGEQKLIAFARAFLCEPELLFLDEWEESLDYKSLRRLLKIIRDWKTEDKTLLFVSHNSVVIQEFAGSICVIQNGSISEITTHNDFVKKEFAHEIQN